MILVKYIMLNSVFAEKKSSLLGITLTHLGQYCRALKVSLLLELNNPWTVRPVAEDL